MTTFFVMFVLLPLAELWLLIKVGAALGGGLILAWIIATGLIGVSLIKRQGLTMLLSANRRYQDGELLAADFAQGILLAIAGVLLLIPGFMTDGLGVALLSPWLRRLLAQRMLKHMTVQAAGGTGFEYRSQHFNQTRSGPESEDIIEGEYYEIKTDKTLPKE